MMDDEYWMGNTPELHWDKAVKCHDVGLLLAEKYNWPILALEAIGVRIAPARAAIVAQNDEVLCNKKTKATRDALMAELDGLVRDFKREHDTGKVEEPDRIAIGWKKHKIGRTKTIAPKGKVWMFWKTLGHLMIQFLLSWDMGSFKDPDGLPRTYHVKWVVRRKDDPRSRLEFGDFDPETEGVSEFTERDRLEVLAVGYEAGDVMFASAQFVNIAGKSGWCEIRKIPLI
jgi:hypothetical protein